jgi:hypothetical protein
MTVIELKEYNINKVWQSSFYKCLKLFGRILTNVLIWPTVLIITQGFTGNKREPYRFRLLLFKTSYHKLKEL